MEWTKPMTCRLIELYSEKRMLWDPDDADYKQRSKKHEAWVELSDEMQVNVTEVEKKMRILVGQFQRELRGTKNIPDYVSKWAFFKKLYYLEDRNPLPRSREPVFLQPASDEDSVQSHDTKEGIILEGGIHSFSDSNHYAEVREEDSQQVTKNSHSVYLTPKVKGLKRKVESFSEEDTSKKRLAINLKTRDEFDIFGEYVALTLRNLRKRSSQSNAKFQISNVLYKIEMDDQ